jgi:succinate dehydrogenase / fumarate reductase cytochrome b subunit
MVVHLLTNSTILDSPGTFQRAVFGIHGLGSALPLVEWVFIFIPILFHAIIGVVIIAGGIPNTQAYPYARNFLYTMQRATGMIAFLFIMWHVFHMHGWFHSQWWIDNVATPLGGHMFRPYNAASTLGEAMQGTGAIIVILLYAIGVLSCVFHLANGIWTMGITWGVWISPEAQTRASWACGGLGVLLAIVGMSALFGAATVDTEAAKAVEDRMYEHKVAAGDIKADEHKRSHGEAHDTVATAEEPQSQNEAPAEATADSASPEVEVEAEIEEAEAPPATESTSGEADPRAIEPSPPTPPAE